MPGKGKRNSAASTYSSSKKRRERDLSPSSGSQQSDSKTSARQKSNGRKSDASAKSAKKPAKAANSDQSDDDDDQKSRKRKRLSQDKITSTIAPLRKNGTGGPTKADRDSVKNRKSVRSESEASEAESVDAEEWHAKHKKLPSWEDLIRSVRTIEKPSVNDDNASQKSREKADNVINVCLLWKNGRVSWVSNEVARDKLPQKMLDFYEDHLQFSTTEP
ncbi:hypothetical protein PtB15_14B330 [Puccinia triticina]|nr:hypothetical protein PtB15_14B330 [Puccinia triticina]